MVCAYCKRLQIVSEMHSLQVSSSALRPDREQTQLKYSFFFE